MKIDLTPSLVKAVELATSHITSQDSLLLTAAAESYAIAKFGNEIETGFAPVVMRNQHGFVIAIGELTVNELKESGASEAFSNILDSCLMSGDTMYLAFDHDAVAQDNLPVFAW